MPTDFATDSLTRRLARERRFKLSLQVTLVVFFCVPYFLLEYHPLFPVRTLRLSWLDRAIAFDPLWAWPYQSIYLLINALPWLAASREQLRRYSVGFVALCVVSFAVFLLCPVRAPRLGAEGATGMFELLLRYDRPLNAFPSLHAGLLLYTLAFARRVAGPVIPTKAWMGILAWSGVILYATLATKQHYAVDLMAGAVLAVGCDAWAWRPARGTTARRVTEAPPPPHGEPDSAGAQPMADGDNGPRPRWEIPGRVTD